MKIITQGMLFLELIVRFINEGNSCLRIDGIVIASKGIFMMTRCLWLILRSLLGSLFNVGLSLDGLVRIVIEGICFLIRLFDFSNAILI